MRRAGRQPRNQARTPRTLVALGNMSNPVSLQTSASPGGIAGTAAGFHVAWFGRLTALGTSNNLFSRSSGVAGWQLRQLAPTTLTFRCANGVGTMVDSSAVTLSGLTNQWIGIVGVHTGTQLQLWVNGAQVGSDQAITGYTAFSGRTGVGGVGAASAYLDMVGCGGGTGVPTAANIADWFVQIRARRQIVGVPGVTTTNLWPARPGALVPLDTVGGANMSLVGAGHTDIQTRSPVWGF